MQQAPRQTPTLDRLDLKVRMLKAGIKRGDVAQQVGISRTMLTFVLNGQRTGPSALTHLRKIKRIITKLEAAK